MKGISPLIAVILIVAVTVGVGGLLSVWFSSLTSTQTETVSSSTDKAAKCAASALIVEEVRYKTGHNLVNVTVFYKTGTEPLRNLSVSVTGGGRTNTSSVLYTTSDFSAGQSEAFQINVSGGATIPPDLVTASAFCQTTYSITNSCKSGSACMKQS